MPSLEYIAISHVAAEILLGRVLHATTEVEGARPTISTCGPFAMPGRGAGEAFRCLEWTGGDAESRNVSQERKTLLGSVFEDDDSAFAAARAFVYRHGVEEALAAVARSRGLPVEAGELARLISALHAFTWLFEAAR